MYSRIKPPAQCTAAELESFYRLLLKGGKVEKRGLMNGIRRAKLLAFHYENKTLAGIAAIKSPSDSYRQKVFMKARTSENPDKYNLELGYAVTLEKYSGRHICSRLVEKLISSFPSWNMYATSETTNMCMLKILERNGFQKTGEPYKGSLQSTEREEYFMQLFIRIGCSIHSQNSLKHNSA